MLRSLLIVLTSLFLCGCEKQPSPQVYLHRTLDSMPSEEKNGLEDFFRILVCNNECGYTLFGNKPITVVDRSSEVCSLWNLYHPSEDIIFEKGWTLWQRCNSSFPSDTFVLKENKKDRAFQLYLINKKTVLDAIENHLSIFQQILGDSIQPKELLKEICNPEKNCIETLQGNSVLIGILLGYGQQNALFFERRNHLCITLNKKMIFPFFDDEQELLSPKSHFLVNLSWKEDYQEKSCAPSLSYTSLAEELNDVVSHEEFFALEGGHYLLDYIFPPIFLTRREDSETNELRKSYLTTRERLHHVYAEGSFLEVTLQQWMHPQ